MHKTYNYLFLVFGFLLPVVLGIQGLATIFTKVERMGAALKDSLYSAIP